MSKKYESRKKLFGICIFMKFGEYWYNNFIMK